MTEVANSSETSLHMYRSTHWYIREDRGCHSHHTVKLKSHTELNWFIHTEVYWKLNPVLSFSFTSRNEDWAYCGILAYDMLYFWLSQCVSANPSGLAV
jgi:hypothetical protein